MPFLTLNPHCQSKKRIVSQKLSGIKFCNQITQAQHCVHGNLDQYVSTIQLMNCIWINSIVLFNAVINVYLLNWKVWRMQEIKYCNNVIKTSALGRKKQTRICAAEMAVRYAALSACRKVLMPSVRVEKYGCRQCVPKSTCHCNSLGGATWRSVMITGRTDRQSATQYAAPPREEGRMIKLIKQMSLTWGSIFLLIRM